ncbi:hypothetical protein FH972_023026 [Carpinus fangiana]|uniref:DUF2470 domain-containing protein n=1 Tax=Carpinus fangiana TaxID=176857 RepID=A0A5N6KU93_9ROSI|nr:hypothetical protein FH972_023026 [Carpinus fangiana]
MANKAPSDEATVARIISHMNTDHQDSLMRYLEHYCKLSSFSARNARLTNITKTALTITTSKSTSSATEKPGNTYTIPLDPPLASWSKARPRVVSMDITCIASLNRSPITLKHYIRPGPVHATVLVACVFTIFLFHRRSALLPVLPLASTSSSYDALLPWPRLATQNPELFTWFHKIQPWVFYPLLAAHALESTILGGIVLRRHSVAVGSSLWWTWVASCFLEGFGTFARIKHWAEAEKVKREKSSH